VGLRRRQDFCASQARFSPTELYAAGKFFLEGILVGSL